jgi:hypothetical protein
MPPPSLRAEAIRPVIRQAHQDERAHELDLNVVNDPGTRVERPLAVNLRQLNV